MKVVRLHGARDLRLHEEPDPIPGPNEACLHVTEVGLCGSDLHWFVEEGIGDARLAQPLILGHEFSARTESGERVAVDPAIPCGDCEFCHEGNPNLCPSIRFAGHGSQDGALREQMDWPARNLFRLPDRLSDADGVMLEPLGVALHALDLGHIQAGMTLGVFGCGPIGLLAIQVARHLGAAQIFATDKLAHRVEAARSFGATVLAADGHEAAEILSATRRRGVDLALEAAGDNAAVDAAVAAVKPGGTIVLIGIPPDDRTSFTASTARRKGVTIKLCRRMKHTYPRAIDLVAQGHVDVSSLVTHRFPFGEFDRAFQVAARREGIKVTIAL